MIDNAICEFNKYISDYDLNNSDIKRKYDHVFRVQSYAKVIIESITYDEKLINTVLLAAFRRDKPLSSCILTHKRVCQFKDVLDFRIYA